MISPFLFNIYFEDILQKLKDETGVEIYAFADDLLFTSYNLDDIKKAIKLLEEWCKEEKMIINKSKNKSGILIIQKCNKKNRIKDKSILDIHVDDNYKYLGCIISNWGNIKQATQEIKKKSNYIAWRLAPVIRATSIRFKLNMINTFIRPQFSMLAPLSKELNQTDKNEIEKSYRKIVKKVLGLN